MWQALGAPPFSERQQGDCVSAQGDDRAGEEAEELELSLRSSFQDPLCMAANPSNTLPFHSFPGEIWYPKGSKMPTRSQSLTFRGNQKAKCVLNLEREWLRNGGSLKV